MTRSTFRVLFYANGSKEKNGIVPILGRVTINGTVAQFSCKRSIAKELWDAKGNRAKGKSLEARETNLALDYIKAQIIKHYQRIESAAFSFEEDKNRKGHYHICVNDIPLVQWFRQKANEWRTGLGIAPTRQDKGLKI